MKLALTLRTISFKSTTTKPRSSSWTNRGFKAKCSRHHRTATVASTKEEFTTEAVQFRIDTVTRPPRRTSLYASNADRDTQKRFVAAIPANRKSGSGPRDGATRTHTTRNRPLPLHRNTARRIQRNAPSRRVVGSATCSRSDERVQEGEYWDLCHEDSSVSGGFVTKNSTM